MQNRIKELRKNVLKLTMEKFGERLGVGKTAISNIENGNRNVTEQMCKSICREFGVNEEWLRYGTGDILVIPEDKTAALVAELLDNPDNHFYKSVLNLVATYNQMSPASQKVLEEFAERYLENEKNQKA